LLPLKCSELLAAYAYGRPTSTIDVSAEQSGKDELSLDWSLLSREEVIEVARMSKDAQKSSHAEQARLYELMTKTVPKSLSMAAKLALELAIAHHIPAMTVRRHIAEGSSKNDY